MSSRLFGTVVAAAVLSSCLSVGLMQVIATPTAGAAPGVPQTGTAPTETQLLTEIADNGATTNDKLHVIGGDLQSILSEDKKNESLTDLSAKRLRFINTNLGTFYKKFASDFSYSKPSTNKYTGNEMHTLVAAVCEVELDLTAEAAGDAPIVDFPPCGGR
jgi:hypothetical protein